MTTYAVGSRRGFSVRYPILLLVAAALLAPATDAGSVLPQLKELEDPEAGPTMVVVPQSWRPVTLMDGTPQPATDPLTIRVVPVEINGSTGWSSRENVADLFGAVQKWNEGARGVWKDWNGISLTLEAVLQVTVDLESDDEIRSLQNGADDGGFERNRDAIFIYFAEPEVAGRIGEVLGRDGILPGLAHNSMTDFAGDEGEMRRPQTYFSAVFLLLDSRDMTNNRNVFQNVATHELGHALGLAHTAATGIMSGGRSPRRPDFKVNHDGLFLDDVNVLNALYAPFERPLDFEEGRGGVAGQLRQTLDCETTPDDTSCWPAADGVLIELFRSPEGLDCDGATIDAACTEPEVTGVTGWSVIDNGSVAMPPQNTLSPGRVEFPALDPDTAYIVRYTPVDQGMIDLYDLIAEPPADAGQDVAAFAFELPEFDESWYFNAASDAFARAVPVPGQAFEEFADDVGFDEDADGVSDLEEVAIYGTDETNDDTDEDGQLDGNEISQGTPPLNARPVAFAGADRDVECTSPELTPVQLDGSGSTDTEEDPLTFLWTGPFPDGEGVATGEQPTVLLPDGSTSIDLVVRDPFDLSLEDSVEITVVDTTGPAVECPADIALECSSTGGNPATDEAIQAFLAAASAADVCDPSVELMNDGPEFYDLGGTEVTFGSMDDTGNLGQCSAKLAVQDTTAPEVGCPNCIRLECTGPDGVAADDPRIAEYLAGASASDVCDAALEIVHDAPATFPIDTTLVTFTSDDDSDNVGECTQRLEVFDPLRIVSASFENPLPGGVFASATCVPGLSQVRRNVLTENLGIRAIDQREDGTFIVATNKNITAYRGGSWIQLRRGRLYEVDVVTGRFSLLESWERHRPPFLGTIDAVDELADGSIVFSTGESVVAGFQHQDLYRLDPATGYTGLFFEARTIGVRSIDGVDVYPDGRIAFSTAEDWTIFPDAGPMRLQQHSAYVYDPADASVTEVIAGQEVGFRTLDALTLQTAGDKPPVCASKRFVPDGPSRESFQVPGRMLPVRSR